MSTYLCNVKKYLKFQDLICFFFRTVFVFDKTCYISLSLLICRANYRPILRNCRKVSLTYTFDRERFIR